MKKTVFLCIAIMAFNEVGYSQGDSVVKPPETSLHKKFEIMLGGKVEVGDVYSLSKSFIATPATENILSRREVLNASDKSFPDILSISENRDLNNNYNERIAYDTSHFQLKVGLIDSMQLSDYQVRLIRNNQVILPWTSLNNFSYSSDDFQSNLGSYSIGSQGMLLVDLKNDSDQRIVATFVSWWADVKPKLLDVFSTSEFDDFIRLIKEPVFPDKGWMSDSDKFYENTLDKKWLARYAAKDIDTTTHLPKKLIEPSTENSLIFYLDANIHNKDIVEYSLLKDGKEYTAWKPNNFEYEFIWLKNLPPGGYVLKVRYAMQRQHVLEYPFEIQKAWQQTMAFKIVAGSLTAAFFGFIILLFRTRRQQREAIAANLKRTQLSLSLQSLQSQLNPHFVFNALTSIQRLVNSSRRQDANRYLSGFASLLRRSLDENAELSPLANEMEALSTYLSLEQLRFGFQYSVRAEEAINASATEFPRLLLQPLAENAAKHGVAVLKDKGHIEITFAKQETDMIVVISDNGCGFNVDTPAGGYGIRLTQERIRILNELMPQRSIQMHIASQSSGTVVTLSLKQWLA